MSLASRISDLTNAIATAVNARTGRVGASAYEIAVINGYTGTQAQWLASVGVSDASATTKGLVQLAGDLGGTAASPTVPGLATKANLASPIFTGTPVAPTATAGTNTTQLATTAFVASAASTATAQFSNIRTLTANYTLSLADYGYMIQSDTNNITLTIPLDATANFPIGTTFDLYAYTGSITVAIASGGNLISATSNVVAAFKHGIISKRGASNWYFVDGTNASTISPSFSGTPTAPTAGSGTSTTQIATTAFVTASPTFTGVPQAPTATTTDSSQQIATTGFVKAQAYAPLASPALTGSPTAPTATAGASTTQIATTAFVTAADNLKANIASPTLTGTPVAPTATVADNSTQLATTAFVRTNTAAKFTIPISNANANRWYRVASVTDSGDSSAAEFSALITGIGNYGATSRTNILATVGVYGTSNITARAQILTPGSEYDIGYVKYAYGADIWVRLAPYNDPVSVTLLDSYGVTMRMDSLSSTAPSGYVSFEYGSGGKIYQGALTYASGVGARDGNTNYRNETWADSTHVYLDFACTTQNAIGRDGSMFTVVGSCVPFVTSMFHFAYVINGGWSTATAYINEDLVVRSLNGSIPASSAFSGTATWRRR